MRVNDDQIVVRDALMTEYTALRTKAATETGHEKDRCHECAAFYDAVLRFTNPNIKILERQRVQFNLFCYELFAQKDWFTTMNATAMQAATYLNSCGKAA